MINCELLKNETLLNMLLGNKVYVEKAKKAKTWNQVLECLDSLKMKCTEDQLIYIKNNHWNKLNGELS